MTVAENKQEVGAVLEAENNHLAGNSSTASNPGEAATEIILTATTIPATVDRVPTARKSKSSALESDNNNLISTSSSKISTSSSITSSITSSLPKTSSDSSVTLTAVSSTQTPAKHGHHSGGELAGAAVGTALGAAIITFLITLFLLRRRNSRQNQRPPPSAEQSRSTFPDDSNDGHGGTNAIYAAFVPFLPQSANDKTMGDAVKSLFDQIELHVDNFYHTADVPTEVNLGDSLIDIEPTYLPAPADQLLQQPGIQLAVIKHCLACILVTRMSPSKEPMSTLLPPHLSLLPERKATGTVENKQTLAMEHAYSQWKSINSYLHSQSDNDPSFIEHRERITSQVVETFTAAFRGWQNKTEKDAAAQEHLARVVETASGVAKLIMAQPAAFVFRWQKHSTNRHDDTERSLVIFPAFVKTTDNKGARLHRSQKIVRAVTQQF